MNKQVTDPTVLKLAVDAIEALVAQAKLDHPDLGLSFGYIGNFERWGDDRCFYVFTNRRDSTGRSVSYYIGEPAKLGAHTGAHVAQYLPRFLAKAAEAARR